MSERLRVYELASQLGIGRQELVTKINSMGLGFTVSNVMTVLSVADIERVKRELKKQERAAQAAKKPEPAAPAAAPVRRPSSGDSTSGMIRRGRRKVVEPVVETKPIEPAPRPEPVQPVVRAAKPAESEAPASAPVEATPEAPQADQGENNAPEQTEAPMPEGTQRRRRGGDRKPLPLLGAKPVQAARPHLAPPPEVAEARRDAERRGRGRDGGRGGRDGGRDGGAQRPERGNARPANANANANAGEGNGGAQILGVIDMETLGQRLDNERDFGPAGGRRRPGERRRGERAQDANARPGAGRPGGRPDGRGGRRWVSGSALGGDRRRRGKGKRGKSQQQRQPEPTQIAEHKRVIRIEDAISVGDLAHQMGVKAGQVALKLLDIGMMANVNTTIDVEMAELIAEQFGYKVENVAFDITKFYDTNPDDEETQTLRPPIVTVMGHVDHGKTSLLDAIRTADADVAVGEAGGITQHIGAYTVRTQSGQQVTFLDTPGHEAFTALRARGAQATDIVILVVAADDGVMPQTVEAINHARAAEVPIIVAINKIDKANANPTRVKQALMEYELIGEEFGGDTIVVELSAKQQIGISELLEMLALQSEMEELTARPDRDAQGLVIESELDTGRGPTATILVRRGTLRRGDIVVIGEHYGRVRTMSNHRGVSMDEAGPSIPVVITGLSGVPDAGEPFFVVQEEKDAKTITAHVAEQRRKERMAAMAKSNMDRLVAMLGSDSGVEHKKLKIIVKADVQGSIEALKQAFSKIGNDEVSVNVIHSAVGGVTENDVNLAASVTDTAVLIVGFNTRPDNRAQEVADQYGVRIMTFNIIYDAIDQIRGMLEGLLSPLEEENVIGRAEVRQTFSAPKVGTVAGCYVLDGILRRNARARLVRQGRVVYETTLSSLRRFKDDVSEVRSGFECGTSLDNYNDIKVGDIIEAYEIVEVAATLN